MKKSYSLIDKQRTILLKYLNDEHLSYYDLCILLYILDALSKDVSKKITNRVFEREVAK
jgi:hypothetical protein